MTLRNRAGRAETGAAAFRVRCIRPLAVAIVTLRFQIQRSLRTCFRQVADFQEARLLASYADQRPMPRGDERDARVSASYPLARPKALRVLAGLSH